nr:type II toxin-antitoxin system RelE/ParE family toxin [Myxococcus sp. RHSTA-1-4]
MGEHVTEPEKLKLTRLLDMAASKFPINNREKCKQIEGELWEFKSHQLRLPYVLRPGSLVVVTHVFRKKRDAIPNEEITRAFDIVKYFDKYFDFKTFTYRRE